MLGVLHRELAEFLTAERVVEQGGQNGPVARAFQRLLIGRYEQLAGLGITKGRGLAFVAFVLRALHALDRIVGHGVPVAEILEQRRQRRQPVPDGRAAQLSAIITELVAPGDDMRAGHVAEFLRLLDAGKQHEVLDRMFVGALGAGIADICEPFGLRGNIAQPLELRCG